MSRKFTRACEISGMTRAGWLASRVRRFVAEIESCHNELFDLLTAEEDLLVQIVASGAAEKEHIAAEANMSVSYAVRVLGRLVDRGVLCVLPKGGKTDQARGAKIKLYFVSANFARGR